MAEERRPLPAGVADINRTLTDFLGSVRDDPTKAGALHAVVLFYKNRPPELYVPSNAELDQVPDYPSGGRETKFINRADYVSTVVFTNPDGTDPFWYSVNGRLYHTP